MSQHRRPRYTDRERRRSDGVIAIIITIMVLELKLSHEPTLAALRPLIPTLLSYTMSFLFIGIYWNNHHHMLHTCTRVTASILWANLLLLAACSYTFLQKTIIASQAEHSPLKQAGGAD